MLKVASEAANGTDTSSIESGVVLPGVSNSFFLKHITLPNPGLIRIRQKRCEDNQAGARERVGKRQNHQLSNPTLDTKRILCRCESFSSYDKLKGEHQSELHLVFQKT